METKLSREMAAHATGIEYSLRELLCHLLDVHRSADTSYYVLALCVG